MEKYAQILNFDEFNQIRDGLGRIVCTSGGFDPIHPGHASCIIESKQYGDTLVVVVNGDNFLQRKKGKQFMDLQTRCNLVAACATWISSSPSRSRTIPPSARRCACSGRMSLPRAAIGG